MSDQKKNSLFGSAQLFLAAIIWGVAFVAQRVGMDYVEPFTFNGIRNIIGALVLVPFVLFMGRGQKDQVTGETIGFHLSKETVTGGLVTGVLLAIASNLQQVGIKYTTIGKAGFITAMYIILVPILNRFLGKKLKIRIWLSVLLAVVGMYLLCMTERLVLARGDAIVLACALAFSFQILAVDHYADKVDCVAMACIQFFVCGVLSLICMALTEHPSLSMIWAARIPILYAGMLSTGVAYTFQILGQKKLQPTIASLIMSLESVISALAGWLILGQVLAGKELFGAVLMFAAIIIAQI